ncbi:flagellar hook-associated protein FlgK [Acetivibrio clariflavus]|uniref:Flagellar hook-associated protein 1 n=1 Tax=Acetivibrio clariflavus (strain DSM 19732 / NBRC 101661 / EBR45) TaxID=720554 RepID=G8LTM4_ACECE|nr:flagellar hook-associated protein FlgK [Acetivibrio clariflavus]AEV70534.1 flagellar hook-associated protein FlgK [Acetivibrio clariflavus DSM 19732]
MAIGFASFEIARSGMSVSERALEVTGHNISNVNTKGYARQQAISVTSSYYNTQGYQIGLGATIQNIRQIRHQFLDNIYRRENTSLGYWETRNKTLEDIQYILGDPMERGLQEVMNQFWDAWQELSKDPSSLTVRALVVQRGEALVDQINHIGKQIDKLQDDLNQELKVRIDELNSITRQIAALNTEILKCEINGDNANDYRDQRNALVDRLSKLANIEVNEMQDGQLDITIGGYVLVTKDKQTSLVAETSSKSGLFYIPKIMGTEIEVPIKSGIIKGIMESRGEVMGIRGSIENGTPNTKADITFVVDISDSNKDNLSKVQDSIETYINELKRRGLDYNLRLVTYSGSAVSSYSFSNAEDFRDAVKSLTPTSDTGGDFGAVVSYLESIGDFSPETNKYAVVFSGGDLGVSESTADDYVSALKDKSIKMSIVTDSSYYNAGTAAGIAGWNVISDGTSGSLFDINSADFEALMTDISNSINSDINKEISMVEESSSILSDLRKRINALVNVLVREVNYLHTSGKTLGPPSVPGEDFFVAINPDYPLEMGNIKLNDKIILNLSNIVASKSGASGDNTIALAIANLRGNKCLSDAKGILSIDEYYQLIILDVGNRGSEAAGISESQRKLVNYADSQRQAIMGVSMDEEVSNMLKYKFSYTAASRALNVIDEMIDTIISRMGLVGR